VCLKENTLLVVPTGLGKTAIALLIIAEFLRNHAGRKLIMLAPTRPLCYQHHKFFLNYLILDELQVEAITGEDNEELRRKKWKEQVICATPQITIGDLSRGLVRHSDISLIIFDEAHRAVGAYAYCRIGQDFVNANPKGRIVGMTASLPDDEKRVQEILLNLSIPRIEFRDEKSEDVKEYIHRTDVEWVIKLLQSNNLVKVKSFSGISMKQLLSLRSTVEQKGDFEARSALISAIRLNHAITLLETQSINSFLKFFERLSERNKGIGLKKLMEDPKIRLAFELARGASILGLEHPKMGELKKFLKSLRQNEKAIVFSSYRDSVEDIVTNLSKDGYKVRSLIGRSGRGQSQNEQIKTIEDMNKGIFDILVATQVGEEGLDISECNLVVFYDNVPSAIRLIQRRGRTGRRNSGKVIVLVAKGTKDEAYYWSSQRKLQKSRHVTTKLKNSMKGSAGPLDNYVDISRSSTLVYVDVRESLLLVEELKRLGCRVNIKKLSIGDYVVSSDIVIERKTVDDFVKSIIDGRLFKQLAAMCEEYRRPILIIEGDRRKAVGIGIASIFGALASVVSDFQVTIFMSSGGDETCQLIFHISRREQIEQKKDIRVRSGRKPISAKNAKMYVVSGLPGVSNILAERFLHTFKSIENTFTANTEELMKVEGVGEKLAQRIRSLLSEEYESLK
jgi:Fanconi anemia group M protein